MRPGSAWSEGTIGVTSIERTAYPQFRRLTSARVLHVFFTPVPDEIAWARERTETPEALLALLADLKCFQKMARFCSREEIPQAVTDHVRHCLGLAPEVEPDHGAARTARWHRGQVRKRQGVTRDPRRARTLAKTAIREAAQVRNHPPDLINVALERIVEASLELPAYSTLDEMAATIRAEVNEAIFEGIVARMGPDGRQRAQGLLTTAGSDGRSMFNRLKKPAQRATWSRFKAQAEYLDEVDELGDTAYWLEGVAPGKIADFAGEAAAQDVDTLSRYGDDKRLALVACLVHTARQQARDDLAEMLCKRVASIVKKAKTELGTPQAAERLAEAIARRMPERSLLSIVARTAYWLGWHHHFGPASGSDPKISDPLGRYCMAVFTGGVNVGPYEAARHIAGVSARELSMVRNQHIDLAKLNTAIATVVNAFAELDVVKAWGDGTAVAADGTQVETYIDNLLAETSIRYGGVGGIAYHYISDTYVALFSRFIPCGVWEAVHLIEGLLANTSDIQPSTVHADTQGQSAPVFTLATLFGFDLMPRIRNFKDVIFFRPGEHLIYPHIDTLFGECGRNVIDWRLIERHWQDLMQVAISISQGRLSSATLMRRLRSNCRKNRIYKVFREVGRTVALLRYLADPQLRARITAATNKVESYHGFAQWLSFGNNGVLADNDPAEQEKLIKFNTLLANLVIFHNALDIMDVVRGLVAEGWLITAGQLGAMSPYLRGHISRFGAYATDDLARPPEAFNPVLKEVDFTAPGLAA